MKLTITSITEEGVKAKEDNPIELPTKPVGYTTFERTSLAIRNYFTKRNIWQEAEDNRKEYEIDKDYYRYIIDIVFIRERYDMYTGYKEELEIGDKIEGDIKDNQIINIKLL